MFQEACIAYKKRFIFGKTCIKLIKKLLAASSLFDCILALSVSVFVNEADENEAVKTDAHADVNGIGDFGKLLRLGDSYNRWGC